MADKRVVRRPTKKRKFKPWVHLFLLPALFFYVVFEIYPILMAFINSFFDFRGYVRTGFVGLKNFTRLFTEAPYHERLVGAFEHNVVFFVISFFSELCIAFLLAFLIHRVTKGKEFFKFVYFVPKLLSVVVVGFLFNLILNPVHGGLNAFLNAVGLGFLAKSWLGDPNTALITIIFVNSWYAIGFSMLIFLAGLQSIPSEIPESAKLDGASGFTMLFKITIPMMMQSLMITVILTFIGAFETFELIYAMQGASGSPYYSTDVLTTFFYRLAFGSVGDDSAIGLGSALAVLLFLLVCAASAVLLFFFRKKEVEY
ncbi:carbohydrate ABC transporter permease [Camelliibacillus cellulosilyticus]|uniref:Carbohydrate ABC transporter permease n=1 Tax=Camelliibacillus cellulosilyticus TaxID=2174486 RepID=A0ABV9GP12_9BACL